MSDLSPVFFRLLAKSWHIGAIAWPKCILLGASVGFLKRNAASSSRSVALVPLVPLPLILSKRHGATE